MFWIYVTLAYTRLIPAVVGVSRYPKLDKGLKYIVWWLWLGVIQVSLKLAGALVWKENLALTHYYAPLEVILLTLFFTRQSCYVQYKKPMMIFAGVFALISLTYGYFIGEVSRYNDIAKVTEGIYMFVLCVGFLFSLKGEVARDGRYWVAGGLLVFFATTLVVYVFINIALDHSQQLLLLFNNILEVANIISIITILVGIWRHGSSRYLSRAVL